LLELVPPARKPPESVRNIVAGLSAPAATASTIPVETSNLLEAYRRMQAQNAAAAQRKPPSADPATRATREQAQRTNAAAFDSDLDDDDHAASHVPIATSAQEPGAAAAKETVTPDQLPPQARTTPDPAASAVDDEGAATDVLPAPQTAVAAIAPLALVLNADHRGVAPMELDTP
jgi:hypothetical protein